jgi:hypothetical protein
MPLQIDLRIAAEAEAIRIRSARADRANGPTSDRHCSEARGRVLTGEIRRPKGSDLAGSAIFLTRTRVVDGRGRLIEDVIVPVRVTNPLRSNSNSLVRSVALAEVAKRLSWIASEHRQSLQRAHQREAHIATIAALHHAAPLQPGLFESRTRKPATLIFDDDRKQALESAALLLVAQQSEIVLLLIVGPAA